MTVTVNRDKHCKGDFYDKTSGDINGFKASAASGTFGTSDIIFDQNVDFDGADNCFFPDNNYHFDYSGFAFSTLDSVHNVFFDPFDFGNLTYAIENSDYVRRVYSGDIVASS